MDKEKYKSLTLTKQKIAEVDGERRVTFVASTSSEDRDYEIVKIDTFRLPLKGGGFIRVSELPAEGMDTVDIPFLTDHRMLEVEKTIGSVRRAMFVDGKLIFEAGISSRPYAQDVFKLIDEGHLDNAFSIQYRDYDHNFDTDTDINGEIVEVSLVTRGSNKDAHVLAVKSLNKGDNQMNDNETKPKTESEIPENAPETTPETTEGTQEAEKSFGADGVKDKAMNVQATIAKTLVTQPTQKVTSSAPSSYLKSKAAMHDFAQTIINNRGNRALVLKAWVAHLRSKGIEGDAILPSQIENIFFKTWEDNEGILGTFRRSRLRYGSVNAFTGSGEDIRAKGHRKGDTKAAQRIINMRRDLKVKVIYKMLPLDLQDLLDDTTGEVLRFRTEELAGRVANEIALGAILGDGREAPEDDDDPDYRVFDGTRGLFSMAADIAASAQVSPTRSFAKAVASELSAANGDDWYDKIIKTLAKVKPVRQGGKKVLVLPTDALTTLLLSKNENGGRLFVPGTNFEDVFRCKIFEMEEMDNADYDCIAYADQGYSLLGTDEMVRTDYDIKKNQDVMLVERAVAGSLEGHRVAAGYKKSTQTTNNEG